MALLDWILEPKNGWKVLGAVVALVAVFGIFIFLTASDSENHQPEPTNTTSQESSSLQEPNTTIQLLASAKELLNKPSPSAADIEQAERYLRSIPGDADEYNAAQLLLAKVPQTKLPSNSVSAPATSDENKAPVRKINKQEEIVKMQERMNKIAPGFSLTLQGTNEDALRFEHSQMSRSLVTQIVNGRGFSNAMTNLGIKSVIFTNGKEYTSSYNF